MSLLSRVIWVIELCKGVSHAGFTVFDKIWLYQTKVRGKYDMTVTEAGYTRRMNPSAHSLQTMNDAYECLGYLTPVVG